MIFLLLGCDRRNCQQSCSVLTDVSATVTFSVILACLIAGSSVRMPSGSAKCAGVDVSSCPLEAGKLSLLRVQHEDIHIASFILAQRDVFYFVVLLFLFLGLYFLLCCISVAFGAQ